MKKVQVFPLAVFVLLALSACGGREIISSAGVESSSSVGLPSSESSSSETSTDVSSSDASSSSDVVSSSNDSSSSGASSSTDASSSSSATNSSSSSDTTSSSSGATSSSSSSVGSSSNSSSSSVSDPLAVFKNAISSSKATKVASDEIYALSSRSVRLHSTATLLVEWGSPLKAKYDFTREKLNGIEASSMIGVDSGTLYATPADQKVLISAFDWNTGIDAYASLLTLSLTPDYFASTSIEGNVLTVDLLTDKISAFIGTQTSFSSLKAVLSLSSDSTHVSSLSFAGIAGEAQVTLTYAYFYEAINIIIP